MATAEKLQELVLQRLDKDGSIANTAGLTLDGKPVDQLALLGVLNSLLSKEVCQQVEWVLTSKDHALFADQLGQNA